MRVYSVTYEANHDVPLILPPATCATKIKAGTGIRLVLFVVIVDISAF